MSYSKCTRCDEIKPIVELTECSEYHNIKEGEIVCDDCLKIETLNKIEDN